MGGWFWRRLGRGTPEEEVDRELAFHLEMRAREFEAEGYTEEAAREAAKASFGDVSGVAGGMVEARARRGRVRDRRELWSGLVADAARAVRLVRRSPGFSAAVVLSLGAGVCLAVVWSAVATAYLVNPLPFPDADRLVRITGSGAPDWMDPPAAFERAVSWDLDVLSIIGDGRPRSVRTSWVTSDWFEVAGARPAVGRLFGPEEVGPGGAAVAVISHALWQTRWGGDPAIVGRTFTAYASDRPDESEVFTIVGVLEPGFWFVNDYTEVVAPLRASHPMYMATLRPGVGLEEAEAQLRRRAAADRETAAGEAVDVRLALETDAYVERVRPVIIMLGGAVALVLAIALANALSLVLVRALAREPEFAIRAAIGAGRSRIARQLFAEGLTLSVAASAIGAATAWLTLSATRGFLPAVLGAGVPGGENALKIGGWAIATAVVTCVLIGVVLAFVPLLNLWRPGLFGSLRSGSRGTASRSRQRLRSVLVAGELALSLTLAVAAGLLLRSAFHLQSRPLGFDPAGATALSVGLRHSEFADVAVRAELFERVKRTIEREVPGTVTTLAGWAPMSRSWAFPVETPGQPALAEGGPTAFATAVGPDYFEVLSIPVLTGRVFTRDDRTTSELVAVVSRSMADRLWPGADPIGRRIRVAPGTAATMLGDSRGEWRTVAGVVGDVTNTLTGEDAPDLYYPISQSPPFYAEIILKDGSGPLRLEDVRAAVWQVYPDVPLDASRRLDAVVADILLPSRFLAWLVFAFGGFSIALAAVGIYGVVAFTVSQGRRDVAIRIALGATGGRVARAFVRHQSLWIGGGLLAGLVGARALSTVLRSQLHGISTSDSATWMAATLAVGVIALAATWLPARRAARTRPARLLKGE